MENNLVSIITPSYNSIKFIEETILSVLAQSYEEWEMIIVDDVSTDGSDKIVEEYVKKDSRIKFIRLARNSGASKARNRAIEEATGRYIAFLDSDDTWNPSKLEKQVEFLQKNNLALTYSAYDTMDENSSYVNRRSVKESITYTDMLKSNHIGNLTGVYDVKFFGKVYMKEIGHEDYVLWLTLLKKVKEAKGINEPLANYRILSNSLSSNKLKVLKWQWYIYREVEKLNIFQSSYYFIWYIFYALKKRS
jgi:glycosyltransferase involved in cell wall biosynthesis